MRPHGVRGDLLVEPYSETIHSVEVGAQIYFGAQLHERTVKAIRMHRREILLSVVDCDDRAAAELLRGQELLIKLEAAEPLPEGVYYRWEIVGLAVIEEDGRPLGQISDILETGANDVYVVTPEGLGDAEGRTVNTPELLLPAIQSVIREVDLSAGTMVVRVPEGLE